MPSLGGAEWWRAASEHARRVADGPTCSDYYAGSMVHNLSPTYSSVGPPMDGLAPPTGLESLYHQQSEGAKSKQLAACAWCLIYVWFLEDH